MDVHSPSLHIMESETRMARQLLFSITKKDFEVEHFCVGGHGGQNMQKNATGARIRHPASGAVAESRDERSQLQNKKRAFERLIQKPQFKKWYKIQVAKALGYITDIEKIVDEQMAPKNLRCEIQVDGKWVKIDPNDIPTYDELED